MSRSGVEHRIRHWIRDVEHTYNTAIAIEREDRKTKPQPPYRVGTGIFLTRRMIQVWRDRTHYRPEPYRVKPQRYGRKTIRADFLTAATGDVENAVTNGLNGKKSIYGRKRSDDQSTAEMYTGRQ